MNAMDFDDLLRAHGQPARAVPGGRASATRSSFRHVLVDEYQDTNRAQYRWLAAARRGAPQPVRRRRRRPVDLQLPRRRHPQHPRLRGATSPTRAVVKLEQNYRSTQTILTRQRGHREQPRAAEKTLWTESDGGDLIDRPRARGRARRGALRRRRDRAAGRRGHARATRSPSSTGPTRSRACSRTRSCATASPTRSSAARSSTTAPRSRTRSRT